MNKIFKYFSIFASFVLIFFALNSSAFSMNAADVETLRNRMLSSTTMEADEGWDKVEVYRDSTSSMLRAEHNTAQHDSFRWKWDVYLAITWDDLKYGVKIVYREYREYVTPGGRGFIQYEIIDRNMDGIADEWARDYQVTNSCDEENYYFVAPSYPEGYINFDWYKISKEEATKIYEKVITYFLEHFKGNVI